MSEIINKQIPITWLLSVLGAIVVGAFTFGGLYATKASENTSALLRMESALQNATDQLAEVKATIARQATTNERVATQLANIEATNSTQDRRLWQLEHQSRPLITPLPRLPQ